MGIVIVLLGNLSLFDSVRSAIEGHVESAPVSSQTPSSQIQHLQFDELQGQLQVRTSIVDDSNLERVCSCLQSEWMNYMHD